MAADVSGQDPSTEASLVNSTVSDVLELLEDAIAANRPIEIEPYRGQLFDLFAAAFTRDLTGDEGPLGTDELTRLVGARWNLDESARLVTADQTKFSAEDVSKMRALWSLLRMWMEWDYAWHRLPENPSKPR